jgi:holo-[acyl-carrier protein] synthase
LPNRINSPIKGLGIDLICISRIARAYRRRPERFLQRIFTPREVEALRQKKNPFPSMAARFAAKEAIAKALGCGIGAVKWRELEILPGKRGKPAVFLQGGARAWARRCGIHSVEVSISHDGSYAVAAAVACSRNSSNNRANKSLHKNKHLNNFYTSKIKKHRKGDTNESKI